MTGQMHVIIVGNGMFRHWADLEFIQPHNDRFADYVREQWPGARIVREGPETGLDRRGYPRKARELDGRLRQGR